MRLLIASDLHGSVSSLRFLLDKAREIQPDQVVLLGDLVYHGPRNRLPDSYDTMGVLTAMADLPCPVLAVRGNCDAEVDMMLLPFTVAENAWISTDGLHIFCSHGHHLPEVPPIPQVARGTVILRGHTHKPRGESIDGYHFWNPGSMSLPKNGFPCSYGLYEAGLFRVLSLDGAEILRHSPQAD